MSSLCTPLTLHHLRLDSSGYPFVEEVSLDNSNVATTAFVNNAADVAYYDANAGKVAVANNDNHDTANSAFNNNNATDNNDAADNNNSADDDDAADNCWNSQ